MRQIIVLTCAQVKYLATVTYQDQMTSIIPLNQLPIPIVSKSYCMTLRLPFYSGNYSKTGD